MPSKQINYAISTNFRFNCSEIPFVSELAQDVTIPSVKLGQAQITSPFVDYNQPGEKILYAEIDVGFVMDENFDAYTEIYSWMERIAGVPGLSPVPVSQRRTLFADAEITILDNTGNMIRRMIFKDAWPVSLGALEYDSTSSAAPLKSILTLDYTGMIILPFTKNLSGLANIHYNH